MAVASEADLRKLGGFSGEDIPELELMRACVHCGMCLSSCPTYRITGQEMSSPRGRLWLMNAVADGRMELDDPVFTEQMFQCLDCRACEAVCPSGVQYGPLVEASRAQIENHRVRPIRERAVRAATMGWLFGDVRRMRTVVGALGVYQKIGVAKIARKSGLLRLMRSEEMEAMLPPLGQKPVIPGRERWRAVTPTSEVTLFNGCMMGSVFADTNRAAARVMAHNGSDVSVPAGQQCCGALAVHSGMANEARALARKNIDAFEPSGEAPVIVTAAGCGAALKEYGHLLKDDEAYAKRAESFCGRVQDLTEYVGSKPIKTPPKRVTRTVTYQEACHLAHAQRITAQPRKLLNSISGLTLVEMRESSLCCGSAGIYNVLRPEMATELGDRKADNTAATGADEVVTANPGCLLQLRQSLARRRSAMTVKHIADLLDEAYGGEAALPSIRA